MKERIHSLDTLKGIALFFVVYIHTIPLLSSWSVARPLQFLMYNIARFAVPIFFMISGYLLGKKLGDDNGKSFLHRQSHRLTKYYLAGSIAYLPVSLAIEFLKKNTGFGLLPDWQLAITGLEGVIQFFYIGRGIAPFLWFLPALVISLLILQKAAEHDRVAELLGISILLHLAAILGNIYLLFHIPLLVEDALLFGLLFTTAGFFIEKENLENHISVRKLKAATASLILLNLAERAIINSTISFQQTYGWTTPYFWGPYSFFTAPMVVSIFLLMLKKPEFGRNTRINRYGRHTLVGYLAHPAIIGVVAGLALGFEILTGVKINGTIAWSLLLMPISYIVSMEIATRINYLKA